AALRSMILAATLLLWLPAHNAIAQTAAPAGALARGGLDPDDMAWFYNRAGQDVAQTESDLSFCMEFGWNKMHPTIDLMPGTSITEEVMRNILAAGPTFAYT